LHAYTGQDYLPGSIRTLLNRKQFIIKSNSLITSIKIYWFKKKLRQLHARMGNGETNKAGKLSCENGTATEPLCIAIYPYTFALRFFVYEFAFQSSRRTFYPYATLVGFEMMEPPLCVELHVYMQWVTKVCYCEERKPVLLFCARRSSKAI